MLQVVEEGSVVLPLLGKIKDGAAEFFNWAVFEPYQKAVFGDVGVSREAQIRTYRTRLDNDDFEEVTQKDLMERPPEEDRKFARSALLSDMNKMFSVLRTTGDHEIFIEITKPGFQAEYKFNRDIAKSFDKIVDTPLPTEPVIYGGKFRGYKQVAGEELRFEVYVLSVYSKQNVNIYVNGLDDLSLFTELDHNQEVYFWASPLQKYGAFDAYNGSAVFVGMVKSDASSESS